MTELLAKKPEVKPEAKAKYIAERNLKINGKIVAKGESIPDCKHLNELIEKKYVVLHNG